MKKSLYPKTFSKKCYTLMVDAVDTFGTFDPDEIMPYIEERLTPIEFNTIGFFCQWIMKDRENRATSRDTYQSLYKQFLKSLPDDVKSEKKEVKTKPVGGLIRVDIKDILK